MRVERRESCSTSTKKLEYSARADQLVNNSGHHHHLLFGSSSSSRLIQPAMSVMKVAAVFVLAASLFIVTARVAQDDGEEQLMEMEVAVALPVLPPAHAPAPTPAPIIVEDAKGCPGACKGRCALHSRQNVCNRACITCCSTCHCVPPGTSGYRDLCGTCYTKWLTHGNRTKCP